MVPVSHAYVLGREGWEGQEGQEGPEGEEAGEGGCGGVWALLEGCMRTYPYEVGGEEESQYLPDKEDCNI